MMKTNFVLFIVFNYLLEFCIGGYFSTSYCTGYGEEAYYDILCKDPAEFPRDLPKTTEKLTIICLNNSSKSRKIISQVTLKEIKQYDSLVSISFQNCPINDLPEKLFTNFPYLQSVTLDKLPIQRLRNIFFQSENLVELVLTNLFNLEHIDFHLLDSQRSFSRIVFDNTTVDPENLKEILKPVRRSIKEFRFINNRIEIVKLPKRFFLDYQLGLLDVQNNLFLDWDFLTVTKSRKLLLKNSQALKSSFDLSKFSILYLYCELFDLENIGIHGTFPSTISEPFQHVKSLTVKSNSIESLHNSIDQMFPHLQLLDISYNKIKHLQPDLNNLFYKTEIFKLEGNPLHCNCQVRWLSARYKSKIRDFPRCNFGYRNSNLSESTQSDDLFFSQLATDSLICLPPRAPILSISKAEVPIKLTVSGKDKPNNISIVKKEYTLVMNSNQLVELNCETEGDPTPTLIWSDEVGPILTRHPSSHINHSSNRLTVGLEGSNVSSVYICTASNIEGISFALLNLVSKRVDMSIHQNTSVVAFERIISNVNNRNCASKFFAQISELNINETLMWQILYIFICIMNKYYL